MTISRRRKSVPRPTGDALRRGTMLQKYRLEKRIGEGRFSIVYRAYDTIEGVRVALKIFTHSNAATHNMFTHEARVAALLDHPNIVRLKTAEVIDGRYVLVSELGDRSLAHLLTRPRSVRFAMHVLRQVLRGLAYAHERGIIHRDIKPENILVWRDGRVKIGDFGVARFAEPSTHTTVSGTPSYRAPEQAYGRPEFASDVFALGLMFFEIVTRTLPAWPFRWPFERHRIFEQRLPAAVIPVIRRAANFDLARRYSDAGAMLQALSRAFPDTTHPHPSPPHARRVSWQEYRQHEFEHRFGRRLALDFRCNHCSGPVSEFMMACPWCGYRGNSFFGISTFPDACADCEHGVHDDWKFCPWCYGPGFCKVSRIQSQDARYGGRCPKCRSTRLLPHMRHCPWCNARQRPWRTRPLQARCPACKSSIAATYWDHCPWCAKALVTPPRPRKTRRNT